MACERLEGETLLEWDARCQGHDEAGSRIIRQGNDGQYYELIGNEWVLLEGMPSDVPKETDTAGLTPLIDYLNQIAPPSSSGGLPSSGNQLFNPPSGSDLGGTPHDYYVDRFGELYDREGGPVTEAQRKRITGLLGGGGVLGDSDPYAGAANARAERALQEQIRAQRIREAQDQADAIQARLQAAQQARLEGAKFSVTPSMADGYFPGLGANSPLVRAGLADPFQFNPVAFNPERGVNMNEGQIANDLAMIRRIAGQGS